MYETLQLGDLQPESKDVFRIVLLYCTVFFILHAPLCSSSLRFVSNSDSYTFCGSCDFNAGMPLIVCLISLDAVKRHVGLFLLTEQ